MPETTPSLVDFIWKNADDFMTPRDVVHLATTLVLDPDDALFTQGPGVIRTLYDPTCEPWSPKSKRS